MPELVRRHPARERMLIALSQQLVGADKHRLEHALLDVVLVAPPAPRRREQQVIQVPWMRRLVLGKDVPQHRQEVNGPHAGRGL